MIFIPIVRGELAEGDWCGELGITPCWEPMPQEPPIGVCNPDILSRKHFALCEGAMLTVPSIKEDKHLRNLIVYGASLEAAYDAPMTYPGTDLHDLIPDETGLHACIKDVLKTERRDRSTGRMVPQYAGNMTCIEFWRCYADFINAKRQFEATEKRGRIQLGENAYVPSLREQDCIRKMWEDTGDVAEAYDFCGASDIIPWWENGVTGLNDALRTKINVNIYDVLKASYTFATLEVIVPTTTVTARATMEEIKLHRMLLEAQLEARKKMSPWVYGLLAFGIGIVILRR